MGGNWDHPGHRGRGGGWALFPLDTGQLVQPALGRIHYQSTGLTTKSECPVLLAFVSCVNEYGFERYSDIT